MPTGCVAGTEKQGISMNQHIWWIDITQVWVTSNTAYTWCREREREVIERVWPVLTATSDKSSRSGSREK